MCGIVGILNRDIHEPVDQALLKRMTDMMVYRGPSERGTYISGNLGLGHRRLSIIDLASGQQPMIDKERGRVISYNGEIYNYRSIRETILAGKGVQCHTSSDTEVLLQLADLDKFEWLESLNGMFAFAVWEEKAKRLLLARDRLGVKPLYYIDLGVSFIFASEIKPLLIFPGVERRVNDKKVLEYLAFRNIVGEETLFDGIRQLPPGHVIVCEPSSYRLRVERYWREGLGHQLDEHLGRAKATDEQFVDIFSDAVKSRLVSDVPVGTFNSGGVDSSLVTAVVRSFKSDELHTFSVGFEEGSHDESRYAAIIARRCETKHHTLLVKQDEYSRELGKTLWHLEEPINHPHTVQIRLLSQLAKEFVTVVLTGEGADEVFGGYPRYKIIKASSVMQWAPSAIVGPMANLLGRAGARRLSKIAASFGIDETDQAIFNSLCIPAQDIPRIIVERLDVQSRKRIYEQSLLRVPGQIDRLLHFEQRTYLSSLLTRLDKMAASIEARVPFLDFRLVEWSYGIPSRDKIRRFGNKWIVKKAAERWLPHEIIYRRKFGFDVPIGQWLKDAKGLGAQLDILRDITFKQRGYFDHKLVETLIREHTKSELDHTEVLWGLLGFEMWCRLFIDQRTEEVGYV
jgi:asparagine synthase (glutamine-hydrolysing)